MLSSHNVFRLVSDNWPLPNHQTHGHCRTLYIPVVNENDLSSLREVLGVLSIMALTLIMLNLGASFLLLLSSSAQAIAKAPRIISYPLLEEFLPRITKIFLSNTV